MCTHYWGSVQYSNVWKSHVFIEWKIDTHFSIKYTTWLTGTKIEFSISVPSHPPETAYRRTHNTQRMSSNNSHTQELDWLDMTDAQMKMTGFKPITWTWCVIASASWDSWMIYLSLFYSSSLGKSKAFYRDALPLEQLYVEQLLLKELVHPLP